MYDRFEIGVFLWLTQISVWIIVKIILLQCFQSFLLSTFTCSIIEDSLLKRVLYSTRFSSHSLSLQHYKSYRANCDFSLFTFIFPPMGMISDPLDRPLLLAESLIYRQI